MKSKCYYLFNDPFNKGVSQCSAESSVRPLIANCTGNMYTNCPFSTYNKEGRLDYYLLYVVAGTLTIPEESGTVELTQGNLIIFPPKYPYTYNYVGGEHIDYLWVHFTGADAERILKEYKLSVYPKVHKIESSSRIKQRFESLFDACTKHDEFRDYEISALLDRLLICAARSISPRSPTKHNLSDSIQYIGEHYTESISIPQLAQLEHLSTSRYNHLFKMYMGTSPVNYIINLRISSACDLLRNTDLSITQISIMCGYTDTHFFSKTFRARTGVSPIEYRRGVDI